MRSAQPNDKRAMTGEQKQEVVNRLLAAWKREPKLRLGQFIYCVTGGNADEVLFNIEDFTLAEVLETWTRESCDES